MSSLNLTSPAADQNANAFSANATSTHSLLQEWASSAIDFASNNPVSSLAATFFKDYINQNDLLNCTTLVIGSQFYARSALKLYQNNLSREDVKTAAVGIAIVLASYLNSSDRGYNQPAYYGIASLLVAAGFGVHYELNQRHFHRNEKNPDSKDPNLTIQEIPLADLSKLPQSNTPDDFTEEDKDNIHYATQPEIVENNDNDSDNEADLPVQVATPNDEDFS